MNRLNMKLLMVFVLSIVFLSVTACHQHSNREHDRFAEHGEITDHISKELSLRPDQSAQLADFMSWFEERQESLDRKAELREIFLGELTKDTLDEAYLQQVSVNYIMELDQAAQEFITQLARFHNSLSDEQMTKMAGLIENDKGRWSRRRKR